MIWRVRDPYNERYNPTARLFYPTLALQFDRGTCRLVRRSGGRAWGDCGEGGVDQDDPVGLFLLNFFQLVSAWSGVLSPDLAQYHGITLHRGSQVSSRALYHLYGRPCRQYGAETAMNLERHQGFARSRELFLCSGQGYHEGLPADGYFITRQ